MTPNSAQRPEMETEATQTEHGWQDKDGFVGPFQPGNGPRSDPRNAFPTGPDLDSPFPNVSCHTADGTPFDFNQERGQSPAVFIFFRSAVW